jgi:hypothetical protein
LWFSLCRGLEYSGSTYSERVQCLALSPNDDYLAAGLNGVVRLSKLGEYAEPRDVHLPGSPLVAGISFSADATELVISARVGKDVHVYTYRMPDAIVNRYDAYTIGNVR